MNPGPDMFDKSKKLTPAPSDRPGSWDQKEIPLWPKSRLAAPTQRS
jgi:hypothetical protein